MSERVQRAAINLLAEDNPTAEQSAARLSRVLQHGPKMVAQELRRNWLPKGWSESAESKGNHPQENFSPDCQESQDGAEADSRKEEKAGQTWSRLSPQDRQTLLQGVKLLSPTSGLEKDLQHSLEQNESSLLNAG